VRRFNTEFSAEFSAGFIIESGAASRHKFVASTRQRVARARDSGSLIAEQHHPALKNHAPDDG
jgi:hypothetical protein